MMVNRCLSRHLTYYSYHDPCTSPLRSDVQGYAKIGVLRTPASAIRTAPCMYLCR